MTGGAHQVAPVLVQRACAALDTRLVTPVCEFWRAFLSRTLQLARSPTEGSERSNHANRSFGMSFDHQIFVPSWCDWVCPIDPQCPHALKHRLGTAGVRSPRDATSMRAMMHGHNRATLRRMARMTTAYATRI